MIFVGEGARCGLDYSRMEHYHAYKIAEAGRGIH